MDKNTLLAKRLKLVDQLFSGNSVLPGVKRRIEFIDRKLDAIDTCDLTILSRCVDEHEQLADDLHDFLKKVESWRISQ